MIRKAQPQDKGKVCDLVLMASSCLYSDVLQTDDFKKQKELLMKYYDMPMTKMTMDNVLVYIHDGEVAGCLVWYDSSDEKEMIKNMESVLTTDYKYVLEGLNNTIYLDSMAVDDKFQGLGISRKLLNYAIEHSDKDLSLLVETYKTDVEDYYKRVGFEVVKTVEAFDCELDVMIYKINA